MKNLKTVQDLAGKLDESQRYRELDFYAEDRNGTDLRVKKVVVNKTSVTFFTIPMESKANFLDCEDVEEAIGCAGLKHTLTVVLPKGHGKAYPVKYIGNGCAGYTYLSPKIR